MPSGTRPCAGWRQVLALATLALALILGSSPPAHAGETAPLTPQQIEPRTLDERPRGFSLSAREAIRIADREPEVRDERDGGAGLRRFVAIPAYTGDPYRWQVTYSRGGIGVVEVHLDSRSGRVLEVWTGPQVDFPLARPRASKNGGVLNSVWIWAPLCLLFLAPFVDPRRPFRLLHLDLLVLLSFGVAQLLFNAGELYLWVPAVYPLLGYLLVRLLCAGFRPRERAEPLVPFAPDSWLLAGLVCLVVLRIVLNVVDSTVIDVGYASVIGADRIVGGQELYTANEAHGDAYGPLTYLAYVPFELLLPESGVWASVPAAHAASISFDLLTVGGLVLLGRRMRSGQEGRQLGLALGFAWVAFPYSTYVLQSNTNDGLVAMLLVFALLALHSPAGRGLAVGLGAAAKFVSLALVPLLAAGTGDRRPGAVLRFAGAFTLVCAAAVVAFLPDGGPREMWDATLGFQLSREAPFSLWGLHRSLAWLQTGVQAAAIVLCAALALVPRRRDARQVAALAGAALIALQLGATYWFFFYIAWFAPVVLIALLAAYRNPDAKPKSASGRRVTDAGRRPPVQGSVSVRGRSDRSSAPDYRSQDRTAVPINGSMKKHHHTAPSSTVAIEAPAPVRRFGMVALYSATLVVSAALVFMVQPMFARFVLPLLGGSPAVWTTAMLFFQSALLLSYLYAHWSTRRFGPRRQAALHLALVAAALLVLPLGVPDWTPPVESSPVLWLLLLLLVSVGLPFFVVSSTAPLLQSWLAATDHPDGRDPYFLYRASNIGSVIGLLSYPLLVERELTLDAQSWLWSAGYGLLAVLLSASALVMWRSRRPVPAAEAEPDQPAERISAGRRVRWVALAFVPSSLMLGATSAMTMNLAPIPLLWVLPLSLYLISFILVFSRGQGAGPWHRYALYAMPPLVVVLGGMVVIGISDPLGLVIGANLAAFFAVALVMHGELAADRPTAAQLTQFFAWVSVGGALGGVFNVILAPSVFNSLTEYPLVLILAAFLLPMRAGGWHDQLSFRRHLLGPLLVGAVGTGLLLVTEGHVWEHRAVLIAMGLACVSMLRNPLRFGLALSLALLSIWGSTVGEANVIYQDRSFFGINRVEETLGGIVHELKNGNIVHGAQIGSVGISTTPPAQSDSCSTACPTARS
jgi:hypothetical protein